MRIEILDKAEDDLVAGFHFYERQGAGLGTYFLEVLYSDIDSLKLYAGMHRQVHRDFYRLLSKRFPFAIYYKANVSIVFVHAVVDCRRSPAWIRRRLG